MKVRCKDFSIKSIYIGSRLRNGPQWGYRVIYTAPDGRDTCLGETFYRKVDAKRAISAQVRLMNRLIGQYEARKGSDGNM